MPRAAYRYLAGCSDGGGMEELLDVGPGEGGADYQVSVLADDELGGTHRLQAEDLGAGDGARGERHGADVDTRCHRLGFSKSVRPRRPDDR